MTTQALRTLAFALLTAALAATAGCDLLDDAQDRLDVRSTGGGGGDAYSDASPGPWDAAGSTELGDGLDTPDATTASPDTAAAPTDTALPSPPPPPTVTVAFSVLRIRSVTVGGTQAAEGEFTWNATGAAGLRVSVQLKTDLAQPHWSTLIADRDPQDAGSAPLPLSQRYHFRAVATHPAHPGASWSSAIVSIP